jgi:arylamine N-acetyltransferase
MDAVLHHLGLTRPVTPTVDFVRDLLAAYVRTVPWGSVARIARKATHAPGDRPRNPEAFWVDVIERGGDGTCFESNGAVFALLRDLGYMGYLTVNNMGDNIGCHSAIVLQIDGEKWLADFGLPVGAPVRLDPAHITTAHWAFHEYAAVPSPGGGAYTIARSHHPRAVAFTLIDTPVDADTYWARTVRDHEPDGFFLDAVILNKEVDGAYWRYNGRENPNQFEVFTGGGHKQTHPVTGELAVALAGRFAVDVALVRTALAAAES